MSDTPRRPTSNDDREGWAAYWAAQGMPWRTEPEIDEERQRFLTERRALKPDIERGIYPFRDENGGIKLNRADVEWLLATHEHGGLRGPVEWSDPAQRWHDGIDVRGADLSDSDLRRLPLGRLRAGLSGSDWDRVSPRAKKLASVSLARALLTYSYLEGSALTYADMTDARLIEVHLEGADLFGARLEAVRPINLRGAYFDSATKLRNISLANNRGAAPRLAEVHWGGAVLAVINWSSVRMLGEEFVAHQPTTANSQRKSRQTRLGGLSEGCTSKPPTHGSVARSRTR